MQVMQLAVFVDGIPVFSGYADQVLLSFCADRKSHLVERRVAWRKAEPDNSLVTVAALDLYHIVALVQMEDDWLLGV